MMRRAPQKIDPERVGIDALGFIAADEERLDRFIALTGILPDAIAPALREPVFLAAILDHLMSDERLLLAFASENRLRPEAIADAHRALSGSGGEFA